MISNPILISSLVGSLALGAVALDGGSTPLVGFVRRMLGLQERQPRVQAPVVLEPKLETSDGWTTIKCDDVSAFSEWLDTDGEALPFRPGEHPSLGSHLLIEFYDCDKSSLESEVVVGVAMRDAAKNSEATVVDQSFHEFKPYGVSGAVIIQESHYTIHTWPEHGYAAIDLFYCGGTVRVQKALDTLKERFQPGRIKFIVVRRGVQDEVQR